MEVAQAGITARVALRASTAERTSTRRPGERRDPATLHHFRGIDYTKIARTVTPPAFTTPSHTPVAC
jgi:hypothetical protein